jgi:acylglycerol lipase
MNAVPHPPQTLSPARYLPALRSASPPATGLVRETNGRFVMADGAVLPYREWLPAGAPATVILAFHGFNDSADAWEAPARLFVKAGMAVIAPDQRGFGAASGRGRWYGTERLVEDALAVITATRARFPMARLFVAGESMGAAILMVLATRRTRPAVDGYILSAPAVWGRKEMRAAHRLSLWLAHKTVPWLRLNIAGLAPPLTDGAMRPGRPSGSLPTARIDALKGLADLMDAALSSGGCGAVPTLFLYGGQDRVIPHRSMANCWRVQQKTALDRSLAFYPGGHHLLQRDGAGADVTRDIISWLRSPGSPLPSGADNHAADWLAKLAA